MSDAAKPLGAGRPLKGLLEKPWLWAYAAALAQRHRAHQRVGHGGATTGVAARCVRRHDANVSFTDGARERGATLIVVGLPLSLRGEHGESAAHAESFAEALRGVVDLPIELHDEGVAAWSTPLPPP